MTDTPPPPPLYDPNNLNITAAQLQPIIADVPPVPSTAKPNLHLYPKYYGARVINAQALSNNPTSYSLREYSTKTITFSTKEYVIPKIKLVNYTNSQIKILNTAFAAIRYAAAKDISSASLTTVLNGLR
jgi:hypothetical protein